MGSIFKFLQSLTRLANKGDIKIDDAYKFAKQEFGEVSDLLKLQINKIFKESKAPSIKQPKKEGEVIEASFKPGMDKRGKIIEESPSQASGIMSEADMDIADIQKTMDDLDATEAAADAFSKKEGIKSTDQASPLMKNIEDIKKNIQGMSENNPKTFRMSDEERVALGYPNRMIEGIVRTAAREILSKKGIDVSKADPIDTFSDIFGVGPLERLDDMSEELLSAQDYKQLNSILQKNEMYDLKPQQGLDLKKSDEIEELTEFDPTDREPNAMGGMNRINFRIGSLPTGIQALVKGINKKFGKGAMKTADEIDQPEKTTQQLISEFESRNKPDAITMEPREILDVPEVPEGFSLSKEKLMAKFPEIEESFADQMMDMDKDMQGRIIKMLENRRLDPEAYDRLLEKYGDTLEFQSKFDEVVRRKNNNQGGLNYLMGM